MRLLDLIPEAFASLRRNRLRSLLTMLGVIIGIFTVLLTLGIGAGARTAIEQQIAALGSNLVVLNSGPPPASGQQAIYSMLTMQTQSSVSALLSLRLRRNRRRGWPSLPAPRSCRTTLSWE
jgi:putative ABC transport system permease protein